MTNQSQSFASNPLTGDISFGVTAELDLPGNDDINITEIDTECNFQYEQSEESNGSTEATGIDSLNIEGGINSMATNRVILLNFEFAIHVLIFFSLTLLSERRIR